MIFRTSTNKAFVTFFVFVFAFLSPKEKNTNQIGTNRGPAINFKPYWECRSDYIASSYERLPSSITTTSGLLNPKDNGCD